MSGQLLQFPIRDKDQIKRLACARRIAIRAYLPVRSIEAWMIEKECSQDALNYLSELAAAHACKNQWKNQMSKYEKYSNQNERKTWRDTLALIAAVFIIGAIAGASLALAVIQSRGKCVADGFDETFEVSPTHRQHLSPPPSENP